MAKNWRTATAAIVWRLGSVKRAGDKLDGKPDQPNQLWISLLRDILLYETEAMVMENGVQNVLNYRPLQELEAIVFEIWSKNCSMKEVNFYKLCKELEKVKL